MGIDRPCHLAYIRHVPDLREPDLSTASAPGASRFRQLLDTSIPFRLLMFVGVPIGIIAALIAGSAWVGTAGEAHQAELAAAGPDGADARFYCEREVESLLKAPTTAEFSSTASASGSPYTVSGTVDAENSFGAMLRSEFRCTVEFLGNQHRVTVDYFE